MKLEWQQAPVKTQWGQDMVVASVAIDNDHTLDLYCERDQTQKVEIMLKQREWQGLTDEEKDDIWHTVGNSDAHGDVDGWSGRDVMNAIEAKLKQKNGYAEEKNT